MLSALKKTLLNPVSFVIIYIVLMIPTYILPYFGSNSYAAQGLNAALGAATHSNGVGLHFLFIIHALFLLGLAVITFFRGASIDKKWLVIFPILALVFDMAPGINNIPMIPTVMHLLAIILGVVGSKKQ